MSSEVKTKFKETLKSTKGLLNAVKNATHEQLQRRAPNVVHSLDRTFDEASKTLSEFVDSLDKRTAKEQLELLKGYRSLLGKQSDIVAAKIAALEKGNNVNVEGKDNNVHA
jgi:hypothetical protein